MASFNLRLEVSAHFALNLRVLLGVTLLCIRFDVINCTSQNLCPLVVFDLFRFSVGLVQRLNPLLEIVSENLLDLLDSS